MMDYESRDDEKNHPWEDYDDTSVNHYSLDDERNYSHNELSVNTFTLTEN